MKGLIFFSIFLTTVCFAQEGDPVVMDISLTDMCAHQETPASESQLQENCVHCNGENRFHDDDVEEFAALAPMLVHHQSCNAITSLANSGAAPLELTLTDDAGDPWKIRFHFGFTRTNYRSTDVTLESSEVNTTIRGFQFDERTSASHYNPGNWKEFQDAFRWLDEPSNTFEISVENKKNALYLTIFHPKTLATYYQRTNEDGSITNIKAPESAYLSFDPSINQHLIPEGASALEIQNTHKLMNYSVGYGRKFNIFDSNAGKLTYVARVDVGALVGAARSLHFTEEGQFSEHTDKMRVQGITGSLGHRVEYQKGKVGLFVDQRYTKTQVEHAFLDGKAKYDLDFSTITFGVNVDLFTMDKKKRKKKELPTLNEASENERLDAPIAP